MKDETARALLRRLAEEELPAPSWNRVDLRARFEDQFEQRREPFRALPWVQLAVYAGGGVALAALAIWTFITLLD